MIEVRADENAGNIGFRFLTAHHIVSRAPVIPTNEASKYVVLSPTSRFYVLEVLENKGDGGG